MTVSRRGFVASLAAAGVGLSAAHEPHRRRATDSAQPSQRPRPTPSQLLWQRDELALFLHFGVNTFTDREWGDGTESPEIFDPSALDARQWARSARAAGFKAMILTAKHHDGFCLWPTATTRHSVASSPFLGGRGDVVREFVDACAAEGLRAGVYLSPWDRNHPTYGDSPAYNDVYAAQLTELLTQYGSIHEVWHDGANGEGPNGKRQEYDWPRVWSLVKRLQPEAVIFSDAGPDVRWIGNEIGVAGETNWSTVRPEIVPVPGLSGDEVMRSLQQGDRDGTVWRPGETDVSIRPGWFYHPAEDNRVRSAENLEQLYFSSVGRNSKLLLNVPPTRAGLLHEADLRSLRGMRERLDARFANDVSVGAARDFAPVDRTTAVAELRFARPAHVHTIDLAEEIAEGQRVAQFTVEGLDGATWTPLHRGSTIGYRRLLAIEPRLLGGLRVRIEDAVEPPIPLLDSEGRCNTFHGSFYMEVVAMFIPSPHGYTWQQRTELWRRYRAGDSIREIAADLAKNPGAVHGVIRLEGGISPRLRARSERALSFEERELISRALAAGESYRAIGRRLGRAASTISREVARHGGRTKYRAIRADSRAWESARRPKACRLASRPRLRYLIATKLKQRWSPEQISGWLRLAFPDEPELHVSHETIYRSLYVQTRGVLKKELLKHLRTGRVVRRSRASTRKGQGRGQIVDAIPISARPAEVEDRAVPGHWEGDLLAGGGNTHIATLVERTSRFTILVKVESKEPSRVVPALIRQIRRLPTHVTRSLTWDRGKELAHHQRFTVATGVQVYFCDPYSPWQRGTNENTNGLLRQYFRTGASLANVTQRQLDAVADQLNGRPRKTLGFRTPAEVFDEAVALIA